MIPWLLLAAYLTATATATAVLGWHRRGRAPIAGPTLSVIAGGLAWWAAAKALLVPLSSTGYGGAALMALAPGALVRGRSAAGSLHRRRLGLVLVGASVPVVGNVLSMSSPWHASLPDLTAVLFTATAAIDTDAIFKVGLFDLAPVSVVLDQLADGVFVIDKLARLIDVNGAGRRPLGEMFVVRDITAAHTQQAALAAANYRLRHQVVTIERLRAEQAVRDELTGLHNRRHLVTALDRGIEQALTGGGGLAVVLLDVDHFKAVNDRYGHAVGDAVLVATARVVAAG